MENDLDPIPGFDGGTGSRGEDEAGRKPSSPLHQMSLWVAIVFIVGELAGSGVLALPKALAGTGWVGVAIVVFCCFSAAYSGLHLGKCWIIMEERWPEYRQKIRQPYPAIGYRAVAPKMGIVVSVCVDITLFGVATVYLLLCSQLIGSLLKSSGVVGCHWVLILGAILCPLTLFGTPAEFWPAAVGALVTTVVACLLIITAMAKQASEVTPEYKEVSFLDLCLSFGTILFAFGGASTFPTFQNDMKDKRQFPKAAVFGFLGLLIVYLPVAATGYGVFGSDVNPNVIISLHDGGLRVAAEVLLSCHFFFAFLIVFNPIAQEMEEILKVPRTFGWKRCVTRICIMAAIIFIAETIPHFGNILNLVGASTVTLMTFVFPPIFYMRLCRKAENWPGREIPLFQRVYLIEIMVIGIIGGCISTYASIKDMANPKAFSMPCYMDKTSADS